MAVRRIIGSLPFVAAILLAMLLPLRQEMPPTPIDTDQIVQIMQRIASGEIEETAEETAGQFALVSAGENCLMRHRRLLAGVDRKLRQRFAAARLVEGPLASELRMGTATELEGLVAWRLYLQEADMLVRMGQFEDAAQWFEHAEAVYDVPGECRSDTRLGLGRLALASGDHSTAFAFISEATQLDPGHFNAHFERALISVELIAKEPSICVEAVDALVQSAIHMEALIGTSSQLLRLKERLAQLELSGRAKWFLDGFTEERAGISDLAASAYLAGLQDYTAADTAPCRTEMLTAFEMSLARLESQQEGN